MSLAVKSEKYSFTFWMGDATGPLAHFDIRYKINKDSAIDAEDVLGKFLPEMTFVSFISDFFKLCPCRITLIGTSKDMLIPCIKRVVNAYKKVLDCRAEWETQQKVEGDETKAYDAYRAAVTALEAMDDPKLIVETI